MGKMPGTDGQWGGGSGRHVESGLKDRQLRFWEGVEKGLEKDHRLAKAGVQIIVNRVKEFPVAVEAKGIAVGQLFRGGFKSGFKIFDKIGQGRNLMGKLGFTGEKDSAEEIVKQGHSLASGILKVLSIEGSEIRSNAKMFRVFEHNLKQGAKRVDKAVAQCRSNGENLVGFGVPILAPHTKGFIQVDTEHGVSSFQATDAM
jgi:hypothetical protein